MVPKRFKYIILLLLGWVVSVGVQAQCAMCKASAETSVEAGATAARGINAGVLYLLVFPLSFLALLAWYAFKVRKGAEKSAYV